MLPDNSILAGDALSGGLMRARIAHSPMFATDLETAVHSMRVIAAHAPTVYVGHGGPLAAPSVTSLGTA